MTYTQIVNELVKLYYTNEVWHKKPLSIPEAIKYHDKLLKQGNVLCYEQDDKILGYVEYWRVNKHQLRKIIIEDNFCSYSDNVWSGKICYVANLWIEPEHRKGEVFNWLKKRLFEVNKDCNYFVGEEAFNNNRVRIYKRS